MAQLKEQCEKISGYLGVISFVLNALITAITKMEEEKEKYE